MSFCANCGRQRTGSARFCGGCGTEFTDAPDDSVGPAESVGPADGAAPWAEPGAEPATMAAPADASRWDAPASGSRWDPVTPDPGWAPPADATRMDLTPEPTRMDLGPPTAQRPPAQQPGPDQPDPFASWFVHGKPPEQPTETLLAYRSNSPTGAAPLAPAAQPAPPMRQPPYSPPPGGRSSGGRRGLWIAVVIVLALAAGGGAYAVVKGLGKHPTAQSSTPPTGHASTSAATTAPASPTVSATATASSAASTSVTATPTPSPSLVTIDPGVGSNAATPQVEMLLSHYFDGINTHNYAEYSSTLTAQNQANQPQSSFDSGYSTTTDSDMTLTSLTATGGGDLTATVAFTSHQSPSDSVDNSACNNWTLNFYLVPNGTGYLISPAPTGYQPTYSDC